MAGSPTSHPSSGSCPRLLPRGGPLHFLLLLATSSLTLLLPVAYALALLGIGCWVGWMGFEWVTSLAVHGQVSLQDTRAGIWFALAAVTWVFMLRPFLPRPKKERVAMLVTPACQPRLFELVESICENLRIDPPQEIWLDTTLGTRSSLRNGLWGVATGELHLHLGLPVVSILSAHELAAVLVREMALNASGLGTTFSHLVRELNAWFYQALHERDPWELELRKPRRRDNAGRRLLRYLLRLWMGAAKLPFALFMLTSRIISAAALARLENRADKAGLRALGAVRWRSVQAKYQQLQEAWKTAMTEIDRGLAQQRLPDNVALLVARHVAKKAPDHSAGDPAQAGAPLTGHLLPDLPLSAPGSALLRSFVDLARQVTCFYYQHELGIQLHEHRLVADEEVIHQTQREDPSLAVIHRYFQGLAHPERVLCGLAATPTSNPGLATLVAEIEDRRAGMREWGGHLRSALQEWNLAWQRRRDLEAAALLSLAGLPVSRMQFATDDTSPAAFRGEAARQRMLMEHMEGALTRYEAQLEGRFAAALGLLWWAGVDSLPPPLAARREQLAAWVSAYEALAASMTGFRELLTVFFAFQTLGAKHLWQEDLTQSFTALQTVVPKMTGLIRQILPALDGACHPNPPGRRAVPLAEYLLPVKLPAPVSISMNPGAATDRRALSVKMASDAATSVTPFVDRYLQLYHESFAWLAETAEMSEGHFVGPLSKAAGAARTARAGQRECV